MSSVPSLMDITVSFPVQYSIELNCSSDNLQKKIEDVASFVSKVYAKFPRLEEEERKQLCKEGVMFNESRELASSSECEQFETALKERIITVLSQKKACKCSIQLSTDYMPEEALYEVAKSTFQQKNNLGLLFPYKTCTIIYLKNEKTKLYLDMDFKFPRI